MRNGGGFHSLRTGVIGAGYTHAFCTPHVWPSFPKNNPGEIVRGVERLQAEFDAAGVGLTVMPGGEMNMRRRRRRRGRRSWSATGWPGGSC